MLLKQRVAVPHQLVPGRWLVWAAEIAARTRSQAYCIAEQAGWVNVVFFAYACSTSTSRSENSTSAGWSGHCRPSSVLSMIRHAMTRLMEMARLRRSAVLCCRASIRQPLLSTRCKSSMRHLRQYQRKPFLRLLNGRDGVRTALTILISPQAQPLRATLSKIGCRIQEVTRKSSEFVGLSWIDYYRLIFLYTIKLASEFGG